MDEISPAPTIVNTSLWLDVVGSSLTGVGSNPTGVGRSPTGPELVVTPSLATDTSADVAIIGGGIAGVACAYFLARQGASVVLLERGQLASGASGRNAGFVLGGVAENYVAARARYGPEVAARIFGVTFNSRALLRGAIIQEGIACADTWEGSDQVAVDADEWDELVASAELLAATGVRVTQDALARRVTYEDDGCLDPVRFVRGLAQAALKHGARIYENTAVLGATPSSVASAAATVRAGSVLLCAGGFSTDFAPSRISPVRGQMLATAPIAPGRYPRPTYADHGYRYWRQTPEGRLLVGGWRNWDVENEVGEDNGTSALIQNALDSWLHEQGIVAPVTHRWGGTMDFSHDGLPYIGRRADGLFACGGFTGHGNGFAMAAGEIVAALLGSGYHSDADLFDPERT